MPVFQASLIDPTTSQLAVTFDATNTIATIVEHSNYTTSTEAGNMNANFSVLRKIIVSTQDGVNYIFSSLAGGDALISPGNSGSNSFNYTMSGDQVYTIDLITVPTWNNASAYTTGMHVWYTVTSKYYKCILNGTNHIPSSSPTFWVEVAEENVAAKYQVVGKFARVVDLHECWIRAVNAAVCGMQSCDKYNLCKNPDYLKADQLGNLLSAIENRGESQMWDDVEWMIGMGADICNC